MVLEHQLLPYFDWLLRGGEGEFFGALPRFLLVLLGLGIFALAVGFSIVASRRGLMSGGDVTYRTVAGGFGELLATSPRRVWALARLAIKEAVRRRVIVALVVYLLILLFASWFLRTDMQQPARLYMSFVLTASTYLVLGISLLLSAFSLPADFKSKTIYTVVTKPVRAGEIVLGRIIGFTIVATVLLVIMGAVSYVFVVRSLDHTHRVVAPSLENILDADGKLLRQEGRTSKDAGHSHEIKIDSEGRGDTDVVFGHRHNVDKSGDSYIVSAPLDYLRARNPRYGKLRFIDRGGAPKDKGISVGNEWAYRSFIDGNTPATAIWTFDGISQANAEDVEDGGKVTQALPLSLTVRVFRTHKGVIGRPIRGTIQLRNPDPKNPVTSALLSFDARDQQVDERDIPRKMTTASGQEIDLFDDLVSKDGKLEVLVKCLEGGQYFGFAQADCYLRLADGSPIVSYSKVIASIWVQAVIVIAVGVTISTLVSGPVALLFTAAFIILGFWRQDFLDIAIGKNYGGGPAESIVRIATQANVMTPLDKSVLNSLVSGFDYYLAKPLMWCVAQCLPDFNSLSTVTYAADGYNVPWDRVLQDVTLGIGYVVALSILGFFLLRTRGGSMNQSSQTLQSSFYRKIAYLAGLAVLLFPLARLGAPATREDEGGTLAQLRAENELGQADLGEIDPASETIRLATLGLRGVAVSMLWTKANEYKKTEDWTSFQSTLEQLARLQPYFIGVWRFQSWNLTYNVSVESDDVRDRFYYVKQGIKYLQNGIRYNKDNPTLLADLGWFNGNKVGRADEVAIYRRLYKLDDELHPDTRTAEERDNWLVSKEWYKKAIDSVDFGGKPLGTKNPTTFFDSTARSQISYADAIETEGVFGPRAQEAWHEGGRLWNDYGTREMPASNEVRIRLEDLDKTRAEAKQLHEELDALSPGLGQKMVDEARAKLSKEQLAALNSTAAQPSEAEMKLRDEASEITNITIDKVAARIAKDDPSKAAKAQQLASRIGETENRARLTDINRDVANYDYWKVRCDLEQAPEALKAHELSHAAKKAFQEEADLEGAKRLYEASFEEWAKALERFPNMAPDSPTGSDIMDFIEEYAKLLEQMDLRLSDKDVIDKFALWSIVEANDPQRKFADDLDVWHGRPRGAKAVTAPQDQGAAPLVDPTKAFSD